MISILYSKSVEILHEKIAILMGGRGDSGETLLGILEIFSCGKMVFMIFAVNGIWTFFGDFLELRRYLDIFRQQKTAFDLFSTRSGKGFLGKSRAVKRY